MKKLLHSSRYILAALAYTALTVCAFSEGWSWLLIWKYWHQELQISIPVVAQLIWGQATLAAIIIASAIGLATFAEFLVLIHLWIKTGKNPWRLE